MALVEQKTGSAQGNVNPSLYTLAARQSASGCNSTTGPAGSCVLNDVTAGTNAMPCAAGSPDCLTTNAADSIGVLSGFDASVGYDRATGLGSVNATNLVSKWIVPSAVGQFSVVPNPANVDIAAAGETGAATLVVTGTNGFVGMVSFSCTVSPPAANDSPTCFVFPFSVAINSTTSTTATATLQIKTTSGLSSSARPHHDPGGPTWLLVMASGGLACFVLIGVRRSRQRRVILMMAASLTLLSASLIGCAGGPGGSGQVNLGTPAGNYTATVTATGGGLTQSTTVLVTVQ
jgi:hypothetical protein